MKKFIWSFFFSCTATLISSMLQANENAIKIKDVVYDELSQNKGRVIIELDKDLTMRPEISANKNTLQVVLSGAMVWPRIKKEIAVGGSALNTTLMAYQYNKEDVRVRVILPYDVSGHEGQTGLLVKNRRIYLEFPITQTQGVGGNIVGAQKNTEKSDGYDERLLNNMLEDRKSTKEVEKIKINSRVVSLPTGPKIQELEKKLLGEDKVVTSMSSQKKEEKTNGSFHALGYIAKFSGFLVVVLALFYWLVNSLKKGVLSKGKLGFLSHSNLVTVMSTTYLGPKKSLLLVRVQDQVLLLGSSESGINFLTEIKNVPGILKEGEKIITGENFDSNLNKAQEHNDLDRKVKLKPEESLEKALVQFELSGPTYKEKVRFSDQIKNKVKSLRPLA